MLLIDALGQRDMYLACGGKLEPWCAGESSPAGWEPGLEDSSSPFRVKTSKPIMSGKLIPFQKQFIQLALIIFVFFGASKVITSLGSYPSLARTDPVFYFLSTRQLLFLVGFVELIVARLLVAASFENRVKLLVILWMSLLFASYRLALWASGYIGTCPCFGYIWEWLMVPDIILQRILIGIIVVLGGGAGLFLFQPHSRSPSNVIVED